jgi:hypothetical protein
MEGSIEFFAIETPTGGSSMGSSINEAAAASAPKALRRAAPKLA